MLQIGDIDWKYTEVLSGLNLGEVNILFERIDKNQIEEEIEKMNN